MLLYLNENFNNFNKLSSESNLIDVYQSEIKSLNSKALTCPICNHNTIIKYGFYTRYYLSNTGKHQIKIQRVYCKNCMKHHALLPFVIIPYSNILLFQHLDIIYRYLANLSYEDILINYDIDPIIAFIIIRRFIASNIFFKFDCLNKVFSFNFDKITSFLNSYLAYLKKYFAFIALPT